MKLHKITLTPPIVAIIVSFGLMLSASATSWFVATDGNDTGNDGSETSPFATLAKAYAAAADTGDEIVVKPGTYVMSASLTVKKGVTVRSSTGIAEDVKIDGNAKVTPFVLNHADAKLQDVCVQNGSGTSSGGGNVRLDTNGGRLERCIVRNGKLTPQGLKRGSSGGGGIMCSSDAGLIVNCVITNNSINAETYAQGGGLCMAGGTAVGCFIGYNKGSSSTKIFSYGGGAHVRGGAKLVNCTIAYNSCQLGGGVDAYASTARVINCVLWGNSGDGGVDDYLGLSEVFVNCFSKKQINDTCIAADSLPADGIFLVPTVASPCLDCSEDVEGVELPATDILGNPRVVGGIADLGCAEWQQDADADLRLSKSVGFVPLTVEFAVYTEGLTGITSYDWDFDGDGTVDKTTAEPTVSHTYEDYCVGVLPTVSFVHSGGPLTCPAPGKVSALPKTMYVDGTCKAPAVPYATPSSAATSLAAAVAIAEDGQEIVVMKAGSPYKMNTSGTIVELKKAITVRGETGNPQDVVFTGGSYRAIRVACADAVLHSVTVRKASLTAYGTAIMIDTAGGTVSNCVVRDCGVADYWSSGVVYARGANSLVTHCAITNNQTASNSQGATKGCGLEVKDDAVAANCLIANNKDTTTKSSYTCAGGAYVNGGWLRNCTVVDNAGTYCGGVRVADKKAGRVANCVLAGNKSLQKGDGYHNYETGYGAAFLNCASDDATAIGGTCQRAPASELFNSYGTQDYTVAKDSVLVDNGADYTGMASKDLAGQKRVMGKAVDIGAYEYDNETARLAGSLKADVTEGFYPQTVTFTAGLDGTNGTETVRYTWDFGDGTAAQVTMDNVCPHDYEKGGQFTVKVLIEDLTGKQDCLVEKPNFLYFVGKTMYVTNGVNAAEAFPYDTRETAASKLKTAVDAALDGVDIVVLKGTHFYDNKIEVKQGVTIHGESGVPEDVVVASTINNHESSSVSINHPLAKVYDLTWDYANYKSGFYCPGLSIEAQGGTVSNCVIRNFSNGQYWVSNGALTINGGKGLATHCIITNNTEIYGGDGGKAIVRVLAGRLENSLIAYNRDIECANMPNAYQIVRVNGKLVNCTIVSNETFGTGVHLKDWSLDGNNELVATASVTNAIVACNMIKEGGVSTCETRLSLRSARHKGNITDGATEVPGWYRAADASEIFDAESEVSPWAISLEAAHKFPGARRATADTTDLAGNPRYTGKRLDPGCYQCPKSFGLMLKVK